MPSINSVMDNMGVGTSEFVAAEAAGNVADTVSNVGTPVGVGDVSNGFRIKDIIFTETGPEDDYEGHPLNFARSKGLGKMIRGVTGYVRRFAEVDNLKLAIVDIIFGWFEFWREVKEGKKDGTAGA